MESGDIESVSMCLFVRTYIPTLSNRDQRFACLLTFVKPVQPQDVIAAHLASSANLYILIGDGYHGGLVVLGKGSSAMHYVTGKQVRKLICKLEITSRRGISYNALEMCLPVVLHDRVVII